MAPALQRYSSQMLPDSPPGGSPCAALLVVAIVLLAGCEVHLSDPAKKGASAEEDPKSREVPAVLVEVTRPRREETRDSISLSGDLRSEFDIDLTSRVGAVVAEAPLRAGQSVAKDAILVKLEDDEYRATALQQEQAYREAVERARSVKLEEQEARKSESLKKVALERADKEFARVEALLDVEKLDALSLEEIEAKTFTRDEARLSREIAVLATRRAEVATKLADIAVEQAKSRWDRALLELSWCEVRSPIDGVVSYLEVRPGEMVALGTVVASVVSPQRLYTEVGVPQRRLPSLQVGQEVELTVETYPGREFRGRLEAIYPRVDPSEGTVKVRVAVVDPDGILLPGIYVTARIILAVRPKALLVPKRARLFESNESIVFVVREGKAVRIRVPVGLQTTENLEVLELPGNAGEPRLRDDDLLVIRGQTKLKDGAPVEIQEPAASGADAAEGENADDLGVREDRKG